MPTIYLIDASPYIFRAFYSIPAHIMSPDGAPVNAVYGYTDFLLQILKREPSHIAVAFDGSLTTSFRNQIYPDYKAQRAHPPPELEAQLERCRDVTAAMGMSCFIDQEFEADDLIGTMVQQLRSPKTDFVVISNDKDFTQLVASDVKFWDYARDEWYDSERVEEKFGVAPPQIVDLLALMGDSVDNIPGVKGVGPKSASQLLQQFSTLEEIYDNLNQVEGLEIRGARSLRDKLAAGRESALISQRLARIADEAPISVETEELQYSGALREDVHMLFGNLGLTNLRDRISRFKDS